MEIFLLNPARRNNFSSLETSSGLGFDMLPSNPKSLVKVIDLRSLYLSLFLVIG
jgi:hypothetical protein